MNRFHRVLAAAGTALGGMRRRSSTVAACCLLGIVAMVGGATSAAGNATHTPEKARSRATDLRIVYSDPRGGFGPERYSLRCDPVSGTLPHPRAACAAIANEPELVLAGPGREHSCPAGVSGVRVRGDYLGQRVDATFSPCSTRPGDQLGRWLSLLPATLERQEHVRLDHGFGLFGLGERRATVLGLLYGPQEQLASVSVYRPEAVEGSFTGLRPKKFFGVGYDRAGRVVSLLSDWNMLTFGFSLSLQTPADQSELIGRLKMWLPVRCGGVSGFVDHTPRRHAPRTVVWMTGEQATVDISDPQVAICSAAVRSLIG